MGQALWEAQNGTKHPSAKPLKGSDFKGVYEVVSDHDGDTFRAMYAVEFDDVLYVLDAFQKKSPTKSKTPKVDLDRILRRLKTAREHYETTYVDPES